MKLNVQTGRSWLQQNAKLALKCQSYLACWMTFARAMSAKLIAISFLVIKLKVIPLFFCYSAFSSIPLELAKSERLVKATRQDARKFLKNSDQNDSNLESF